MFAHYGKFPNTISAVSKLMELIMNRIVIAGDNYEYLFLIAQPLEVMK